MIYRRITGFLLALLIGSTTVLAQPKEKDGSSLDPSKMRVISGTVLNELISGVINQICLFSTPDLQNLLSSHTRQTPAITLFPPSTKEQETIWITGLTSTTINPMIISSLDHRLLFEIANNNGIKFLRGMRAGIVQETTYLTVNKEVTTIDKEGKMITKIVTEKVAATQNVVIAPKEEEIKIALDEIAKIDHPAIRLTMELAAGARFAELYPPNTSLSVPRQAKVFADKYRKKVFDDTIKFYKSKTLEGLPPIGEPIVIGNPVIDNLTLLKAIEGAEPIASIDLNSGKFGVMWVGATLVLVRQEQANLKLSLNERWKMMLDLKNKDLNLEPIHISLAPEITTKQTPSKNPPK